MEVGASLYFKVKLALTTVQRFVLINEAERCCIEGKKTEKVEFFEGNEILLACVSLKVLGSE